MSTTNRENGKPLSTADLARAGRRGGAGDPSADTGYSDEDEATRLDVAQPPDDRSRAAADTETREHAAGSSREERKERAERDEERSPSASSARADRDAGSRAVADRIAGSAGAGTAPARARPGSTEQALEPLFASGLAASFRERWTSIQSGFVDDPRQAVRRGDELVAEVMSDLAQGFAAERQRMEAQLDETGEGATENLRVALRRYRSFFERLLAL